MMCLATMTTPRRSDLTILQALCISAILTTVGAFQDAVPFYLELTPVQSGIGGVGRFILENALHRFEPVVEEVWKAELQVPPSANISYFGGFVVPPYLGDKYGDDAFVQQVYLEAAPVEAGTIIKDETLVLNWTQMAFVNNAFLPYLKQVQDDITAGTITLPEGVLDPNPDAMANVEEIIMRTREDYIPTHGFHQLFNIVNDPIQLEFGPANVLNIQDLKDKDPAIEEALGKFFKAVIITALMGAMDASSDIPPAVDIFSVYSPRSDGTFFSASTNFLPELTQKPSIVATYNYRYALDYWVPLGSEESVLLAIKKATVGVVDNSFCCNAFLSYLKDALGPEYESVSSAGVWDANTPAPSSTPSFTLSTFPSAVATGAPTLSQSTSSPTLSPTAVPSRPPTTFAPSIPAAPREIAPTNDSLPTWAIVLIVVAGVIFLAIVLVVVTVAASRRGEDVDQAEQAQLASPETFEEDNVPDDESL